MKLQLLFKMSPIYIEHPVLGTWNIPAMPFGRKNTQFFIKSSMFVANFMLVQIRFGMEENLTFFTIPFRNSSLVYVSI